MPEANRSMPNRHVPAEFAVWAALIATLLLFGAATLTTYRSTAGLTPVLAEVERTRSIEIADDKRG